MPSPIESLFRKMTRHHSGRWWVFLSACSGLSAEPAPDIASVAPDLHVPALVDGLPGAGKRVRVALFPDTPPVVLYLPTDWSPDKKFPVMVELAGNGNYRNAFGGSEGDERHLAR